MSKVNDETPSEKSARCFLADALGVKVTVIATRDSKSPDFLIDGDPTGYLIEEKSRQNDPEYMRALRSGGDTEIARSLGHDRWAMDVSRKAVKQFRTEDPSHRRFWILWLSVDSLGLKEAMWTQAIGSLFGVRQIVYFEGESEDCTMRDCVYATVGVFERWPCIDAAIVSQNQSITLCVNELSERYQAFASSSLHDSFVSKGPVNTATALERDRGFLCVSDRNVDRSNDEELARYIETRYALEKVIVLNMKGYEYTTRVT